MSMRRKSLIGIMTIVLFMTLILSNGLDARGAAGQGTSEAAPPYLTYWETLDSSANGIGEIAVAADQCIVLNGARLTESPSGEKDMSVFIEEGGSAVFPLNVQESGIYEMKLRYHTLEGKGSDMEFSLYLDDDLPFAEAQYLSLKRMYKDSVQPGSRRDAKDNDLTIPQEEVYEWQDAVLEDHGGVYAEPYVFYLEKGRHEITLSSIREAFLLRSLTLIPPEAPPSYDDMLAVWAEEGLTDYTGETITLEAEQCAYKSDSELYGRNDRSSPDTTPYSPSKIRVNTIGGGSFSGAGQWLEWEVDAPEDGLYTLAFRARQNLVSGSFSTRRLELNGRIPFAEAETIEIRYDMSWQNVVLPYKIPLREGRNVLRMTVTPGRLSEVISLVEQSLRRLNEAYRKVIMLTGAEPDPYRDYRLETVIPETFDIFAEQASVLQEADASLLLMTGKRGSMNGILQSFAEMLEEFVEKPEKVQDRTQAFKDNIISLGTWLLDIKNNPLEIDKIYLAADSERIPKANSGFLASAWHEIQAFAASFVEDYNSIGGTNGAENAITVWVQAGRDQANILSEMILNDFTPETGIPVNLKLVQGQLLPATVSGRGPDVALQVGASEPVNYAMRNAAMPLNGFEGFEEVALRFRESALVPFQFEGACYGLPETQTFPVMFYRTDIFAEMGLEPPETWEETFVVIGRLQKNNMNVGIPSTINTLAMLLYQRDGQFYSNGGRASGLSEPEAIDAFETWTSFYADYSLPVSYNAATRFRTGEMPLIIDDFTMYNYFSVMAPEIRGLWSFAPVPGTMRENGTVDHAVAGGGSASMILGGTERPEEAWRFLEWWTRADVQVRYAQSLENQLGESARYATANQEAFSYMTWPFSDYERLDGQWQYVKAIPEVAGGYFTSRHVNNAFQRVYNHGDEAREAILDYASVIDEEIAYKRKEVGLEN